MLKLGPISCHYTRYTAPIPGAHQLVGLYYIPDDLRQDVPSVSQTQGTTVQAPKVQLGLSMN